MQEFKPFIVKDTINKEFKIVEAGSYTARCISVIDLWTQEMEWQGELKEVRKIKITFELPTEKEIFNEEKGEQPFVLSREFTFSLSEKWKLRPFLENWRWKKFTDEELAGFDISKLIWVPWLISVIHSEYKGKVYANIGSVTPLVKWMECPSQINPSILFNVYEYDQEVFDLIPEFIQNKIYKSKEMIQKFWIEELEGDEKMLTI